MPLLIVAGFKADQVPEMNRQNGGVVRAGWETEYLVSDHPSPLLGFRNSRLVLQAAAKSCESHVLAVSEDGDLRRVLSEQI